MGFTTQGPILKACPGLGIGAEILYKIEILKIFYLQGKGELEQIFPLTFEHNILPVHEGYI